MADSTLFRIREKVRNITGRASPLQLSDSQIDFYVNTFYLYDMPENLKLLKLETNYQFFTAPNVEAYDFPVEEFTMVNPPMFVEGYQIGYHQSQEEFYRLWPKTNFEQSLGTGDGTSSPPLTSLTAVPVVPGMVSISSISGGSSIAFLDNGNGSFLSSPMTITGVSNAVTATVSVTNPQVVNGDVVLIDGLFSTTTNPANTIPLESLNRRTFTVSNVTASSFDITADTSSMTTYASGGTASRQAGTINYITGVITLDWGVNIDSGADIFSTSFPYQAARPTDVLFFDNKFHFRPVPDKAYPVSIQAFVNPADLLQSNNSPELNQWWQYLALGASLKIFEDGADMEEYAQFYPVYEKQELLVLRRTLNQLTNQRVSTPYTENRNQGQDYFLPLS